MRPIIIFLIATFLSTVSFGQKSSNKLEKAYHANSNKKLQKFIKKWLKETVFNLDTIELHANDTLDNIYGVLNAFYTPKHPNTKCILMQPAVSFVIVDNLDKDTLLKRAIFKIIRKNPDSVYKKALSKPGSYDGLLEYSGEDYYTIQIKGLIKISTPNLKFNNKKILPLTPKYMAILSSYLLDNSQEKRQERTKRLVFLSKEIEFWQGRGGAIRIGNAPYNISIVIDSLFKNAEVTSRGDTGSGTSRFKKTVTGWAYVESHSISME